MFTNAKDHFSTLSGIYLKMEISNKEAKSIQFNDGFNAAIQMLFSLKKSMKKVMLIGNGGSASIVCHLQTDLINSMQIKALTFYDASLLTAFSNDYGYQFAFEKYIHQWADPDDLLIAISSSGKSENILRAVKEARNKACQIITFSGFSKENPLRSIGDLNFYINSNLYGMVETSHSILAHTLIDIALYDKNRI